MKQIKALVIDHDEENSWKKRLGKQAGITVLDTIDNIEISVTLAERYQPEIIMLNVDLPGNEEYKIAEMFALEFPASSLILMTSSDSKRVLRYALRVGAKEVITLPIDDDKLFHLLDRVVAQETKRQKLVVVEKKVRPQFKTITIFSTKGGVGKTTTAINLALAIRQQTRKRVVLVDLNLTSGNVGLMTGISPRYSIKDLVDEISTLEAGMLESYCSEHSSGLKILPAPSNPEFADFISLEHIERILDLLAQSFNYVIVDAPNFFHDTVLPALERANDIVLLTTLDLAAIQNLKQCLDVLTGINIRSKARVVVNRSGLGGGIKIKDLERELGITIQGEIPNCDKLAINAVNTGIPLLLSSRNSPASKAIGDLALKLVADEDKPNSERRRSILFS